MISTVQLFTGAMQVVVIIKRLYTVTVRGQYYRFNDSSISQIDRETLERESFGRSLRSRGTAYVLFCVRRGAVFKGKPILADFFLPTTSDVGDRDARDFLNFGQPLAEFVLKWPDFGLVRDFYFNIFVRTQLAEFANAFADCFTELSSDFPTWLKSK
jgi:hypothetical protein